MTPRRWIVLGALLAGLVFVQARCLDPRPEVAVEKVYTRISDMPPGDVLPTYVTSLFFGAFRAVAIDFLWIQLKRVEEEKRWYERREILKLISYFQPRNREVWAMLGWHSAYNVANSFTDPERSWEWIRFGLEWLRRGIRQIPDSPYLKFELGWTLHHKPSWRDGWLDLPLLARIEADRELQELLQDRRPIERPKSAFEIAILWYSKAREELLGVADQTITTQMGYRLSAQTADSFIRENMYLQGIYDWRMNRPERAKEWFRAAADQSAKIMREYKVWSLILKDYEHFYNGLPAVVDLELKARGGRPEDERAYLEALQKLIVESGDVGVPDRSFFWSEANPNAPLNRLKQRAAGGRDPQECNDAFKMATPLPEGALVQADISPGGTDVDYYQIGLFPPKPRDGEPPLERPPQPLPVTLTLKRPQGARLDLQISVYNGLRDRIKEDVFRASQEEVRIEFTAEKYGVYYFKVEPAGEAKPWPEDTRYFLIYKTGR